MASQPSNAKVSFDTLSPEINMVLYAGSQGMALLASVAQEQAVRRLGT